MTIAVWSDKNFVAGRAAHKFGMIDFVVFDTFGTPTGKSLHSHDQTENPSQKMIRMGFVAFDLASFGEEKEEKDSKDELSDTEVIK